VKRGKVILYLTVVLLFVAGCDNTDEEADTGSLIVRMSTWNSCVSDSGDGLLKRASASTVYTLNLVDLRNILYQFKVTTDEIQAGVPDDFNWITIYESDSMMHFSEREIQFELPAGNYRGIGLLQSNRLYWVCAYEDSLIYIGDMNNAAAGEDAWIYNIFGEKGLYVLDENGMLGKVQNEEKLGTFEILPGKRTSVTVRMNVKTLDWFDNDGDGKWSEGDAVDNWTLPEGVTTMMDFIVEYE